MFEFIRRHTKIIMVVLFLLVIPSFVFWGIGNFTSMSQGANKVAEVDGQTITQTDWDNAHRRTVDQLRQTNPGVDPAVFDTPLMKYADLERLVRDRVLAAAAADQRLTVSDQRLAAALAQEPAIAELRRPDGTLDMERYRVLVASLGLTPEGFEASERARMAANQVLGGLINSELVSPAQAEVALNAYLERRQVSVQMFKPADYTAKLDPGDADLEAYYKAHLARYQASESASIEYVVLGLDEVKKGVTVSEQELRTYYDQNDATLRTPEQRRASHILINAPKDAPAAERAKAKARADELLAGLRQAPDSFADVARKSSQDTVSAPSGGDLGYLQRDDKGMIPAITQAVYALAKAGDISDVVESDYGYHIVRLTDLKPAVVPPFEQVRAKLEDQYRTQQAQKQFGELAENFKENVFAQSDSLKPAAEQFKLTVHSADHVGRTPARGATGALANPGFLSALFSADSLQQKRNTEAIEIGANQLASGRIVQYTPAHTRPLDEVRNQVRTDFLNERGAALAREDGQAKLKAWSAQPADAAGLPAPVVVSREPPQGQPPQPPQLIDAVLRADPAKLPSFVGVDLGPAGYALARVDKVLPQADQTADAATQNRQGYEQAWAMADAGQFYELLKARYKAAIFAPDPSTLVLKPVSAASR